MKLKLIKEFRFRVEHSSYIVYFGPREPPLRVSSTGKRILDLCNGENTIEDIIKKISTEFNITIEEARGDINGFIDKLEILGLLRKENI